VRDGGRKEEAEHWETTVTNIGKRPKKLVRFHEQAELSKLLTKQTRSSMKILAFAYNRQLVTWVLRGGGRGEGHSSMITRGIWEAGQWSYSNNRHKF
jgi:hypothetical protein